MKPLVAKKWLFFLGGGLWFLAGGNLCFLAYRWFPSSWKFLFWLVLLVSSIFSFFVLKKIAQRNVNFIKARPEKTCVFAFQPWRSYIMIIVMITMGLSLRHSSFPKPWLGLIYTFMGGALSMASFFYFRAGWLYLKTENNCDL